MSALHHGRVEAVAGEAPMPAEVHQAAAQRGEIHVGLSDQALIELALRAVYPHHHTDAVQTAPEGASR